jgi:hypothetical protein
MKMFTRVKGLGFNSNLFVLQIFLFGILLPDILAAIRLSTLVFL